MDHAELAHKFFDAIQTGDRATLDGLCTPDGAIVQHSLTGTLPGGTKLKVPMMVRIFSRDGRFCRFEEYLDPAGTAPLVKAMAGAMPHG